jgi:gp16 family phage-associated protein
MEPRERQEIRKKIREKFGWSIKEWAKRRGFNYQVVYFALKGDRKRAGGRRMEEVLKALEEDLGRAI